MEEWDCAMKWSVITNIETTQQTVQMGAAIESFRNEMVKGNEKLLVQREDVEEREMRTINSLERIKL